MVAIATAPTVRAYVSRFVLSAASSVPIVIMP
jgi:hypothetical protein